MVEDLEDVLTGMDAEWERTGDHSYLVVLPGTRKLKTNCNLFLEDDTLRIEAFVVRCPEQDAERLWRLLLRRNAEMYAVSFAIDDNGDVYLVGRIPSAGVDADELDRLLGSVLTYADDIFNTALEIGFAESIRREWRWRLSRGEPTRNLAAFEHLKPDETRLVAAFFGASAQGRPDVGDRLVATARQAGQLIEHCVRCVVVDRHGTDVLGLGGKPPGVEEPGQFEPTLHVLTRHPYRRPDAFVGERITAGFILDGRFGVSPVPAA